LLRAAFARETDELARGCALEAVLIALARKWPDVAEAEVKWIRRAVLDGTPAIRGRIRHGVDGGAMIGIGEAASAIVGSASKRLPPPGPFWVVESL